MKWMLALMLILIPTIVHATDYSRKLPVGGKSRYYSLHVPRTLPQSPALVLVFHGTGMTGNSMAYYSGLSTKADAAQFVAAYPDGLSGQFNDTTDVAFARAIVADVQLVTKTDPKRTFAAGMSNGAIFCYKLAAEASDVFAAIAPVAGTMLTEPVAPMAAKVSVMHFHGTADSYVPYNGGRFMSSVPNSVLTWAKIDGCATTPVVTQLPNLVNDGTTVSRSVYSGPGAEVVLFTITGGGHTWPGMRTSPRYLGTTSYDISANDLMWEFFKGHGKP